MTISALSSATTTTTTSTTSSTSSLGLETSDFLQLMIEQLQNQNPTDPTDTTEFMNQMIQLSNYDTQVAMSEKMDTLVSSVNSMISSNGLGYIGQTITAEGETTTLQDGEANWNYTLDSDASSVTVSVLDENGDTVYSATSSADAGTYAFSWDGVTSDGEQMDDGGIYTLSVSATDSDGDAVDTSIEIQGKVTGVDSSTDETYLMIGNVGVEFDNVSSIVAS